MGAWDPPWCRWPLELVSSGHWGAPNLGQRVPWSDGAQGGCHAMEQDQAQDASLKGKQCGRSWGATCQLPRCPWVLPHLLCPLWAPVAPGALCTMMLLLSQDRTLWFPNRGVVQTQPNMWVYSGHAEGPLADLSAILPPFFLCIPPVPPPPHSSHLLPLHHSPRLCLLSPGWGSGHQGTTATFPQSLLGGAGVGRGHPGHRGITCTRCYPRITEAVQEMTGIPVFPMEDEWG